MWRLIKRNLLTGVIVLLPLYLTIIILIEFFLLIDGILNRVATLALLAALGLPIGDSKVIYGLGIIMLFVILFITGGLARRYLGVKFLNWINLQLDQIPIINVIYKTLRQISEALLSGKRQAFQKPVLIEYPRRGIYSIAFQTQDQGGVLQKYLPEDAIIVFLPSTPNPTTGFILAVPKSQVIEIDFTLEDAMKLIISGGVIQKPPESPA